MSAALHTEKASSSAPGYRPVASPMLQRKCACGGSSGLTGSCTECENKKLVGQPLQTKLRINEPGDAYEQEADRVADQVMRMAEPVKETDPSTKEAAPLVQQKVSSGSVGDGAAPPIVNHVLSSPGQPLDATTRGFFSARFGHDFANVRLHADAEAAESARSVNALAYTVGPHVVFGAGQYAPGTRAGRYLIAHELRHVIQNQAAGPADYTIQRKLDVAKPPEKTAPEPPVDCTVEMAPYHDCFALIGEMIRIQADIRDNDQYLQRYDSSDLPSDIIDVYVARLKHKAELQKKYNEKERVRKGCCATFEVPGEAPTAVPVSVPLQPTEPAPSR